MNTRKLEFDLVVTRHQGLLDYLDEQGIIYDEHLTHADAEQLRGKCVLGVLPVHLACECSYFTELQLDIPAEMRGKELNLEQVKEYAVQFNTYSITKSRTDLISK